MQGRAESDTVHQAPNEIRAEGGAPAPGRAWRQPWTWALAAAAALALLVMLYKPFVRPHKVTGDHYLYLAINMTHGSLTLDNLPAQVPEDYTLYRGHKYLPLGPLPAVVLMPFLPLARDAADLDMTWVGYLLTALNMALLWLVLRKAGVGAEQGRWVTLLFFAGSVYYSAAVAGSSWFFAHVVTTSCLLGAMLAMLSGRRWVWAAGILLGLAGLARVTSLFALPFFLWLAWRAPIGEETATEAEAGERTQPAWRPGAARMAVLLAGLAGPVALVLLYNYARFDNAFDSGYAGQVMGYPVLKAARDYGLFSLVHVPKNLFMLLLQGPLPYPSADAPVLQSPFAQPSPWGMGIFFTSPALVYAFRADIKKPLVQACWAAVICVLVPLVTYYGIGYVQFGYRYALDFLPFMLALAAVGFPRPMSNLARGLVLASVVVTIWGTRALFL